MKKLLLVDGHSLIHRAYHAYPKTLATKSGELTNAVYGFTNILLMAVAEVQPSHLAVTFDLPKPTFRQAMFVGYKRSRVKPDDELIKQIPRVKEVVSALNIPIYEVAGFEADDVIGTLAKQAISEKSAKSAKISSPRFADEAGSNQIADRSDKPESDLSDLSVIRSSADFSRDSDFSEQVVILTSDRDLMQLIDDERVIVQLPAKGKNPAKIWNEEEFVKEWGFTPELLPDYKAFAGDQSDDIPGVQGVGEKTARGLVSIFGEIDNIYDVIGQKSKVKSQNFNSKFKITDKLVKKLAEGQESAQLSKQLATIDINVPIHLDWELTQVHKYDKDQVMKLFAELEFASLIKKLPNDRFEQEVQEALF